MIYRNIGNSVAVLESALSGFAFKLGQIDVARHSQSFYEAGLWLYREVLEDVRQIKELKFKKRELKRVWIYLYALIVILVPFSNANVAAAPLMDAPAVHNTVADPRVVVLKDFLVQKKSPLAPYAKNFVASADKYGVDWRLLVAISGNESGYGKRYVRGSYNAYGWGGGYMYFKSWEDGINQINRDLAAKYYKHGKRPLTMEQFAKIYSGQPSYLSWAAKISRFMKHISFHKLASR